LSKELPLRECLFVFFLLVLIAFLCFLSLAHDSSDVYPCSFQIEVQGAVIRPGMYSFSEKTTLADLCELVGLQENANLTSIKNKIIDHSQKELVIPIKGQKVIYLKGAVKKIGPCLIPEESRIKDLKDIGLLSKEADNRWTKRKRLLKNQEEVIVPSTNQK